MSASNSPPLPLHPAIFGCPAGVEVTLHQTHIGWVYLAGNYAFKLKKPVKFDFLDFTTVENRRWACERELNLNRRLCPDFYVDMLPVREGLRGKWIDFQPATRSPGVPPSPSSRLREGPGETPGLRTDPIVDWLVRMKRLPLERMLDRLLTANVVTRTDVEAMAAVLTPFYVRQRGSIAPGGLGDLEATRVNVEENLREGAQVDPAVLAPGALKILCAAARNFLSDNADLIRQRAQDGFVVDGHGDLRAENICLPLGQPPVLFDCIEFNDRFRICDSALDAAFLAMDLASRGRADLSAAFLECYRAGCDPQVPEKLMTFYLGYRAFVKAKVAAWISADAAVPQAQREAARVQASGLFDLALRYVLNRESILIVFCGAAGSGKSTLAAELSRRLDIAHESSDLLRDQIVPRGAPVNERYSSQAAGAVYDLLFEKVRATLAARHPIVLDATFTKAALRRKAARIAKECNARSVLVWAQCAPESIGRHLADRQQSGQTFGSEAGKEISQRQQAGFEPPTESEGFDAICPIDTSASLAESHRKTWEAVTAAIRI